MEWYESICRYTVYVSKYISYIYKYYNKRTLPNLPFWKLSTSSSPTQPPLFKQTKEEREISEKVIFLQQGSSAFLEAQVKFKLHRISQKELFFPSCVLLKCLSCFIFL